MRAAAAGVLALLLLAAARAAAAAAAAMAAVDVSALGSPRWPLGILVGPATELRRVGGGDALLDAARMPEVVAAVDAAAAAIDGAWSTVHIDAPADGRTVWFQREAASTRYRDAGLLHWTQAAGWTLVQFNVTLDEAAAAAAVRERAAVNTTLSTATFNIRTGTAMDGENNWPSRKDLVVDVIARHGYDMVGLQEALNFQLQDLLDALPVYRHIGVGRNNGDQLGEYSAILYKAERFAVTASGTFWFCDQPDQPGCTSYGNTIPRIATWGHFVDLATGTAFAHYNCHLDHQSAPSREQSAVQLVDHIRANVPAGLVVLVTGDFNAGEDTLPIETMRQGGFVDTFRVLYPNATDVGTFHGFSGSPGVSKIDYVFATIAPSAATLEAEIVRDNDAGRYPSDHFPVSATVQF